MRSSKTSLYAILGGWLALSVWTLTAQEPAPGALGDSDPAPISLFPAPVSVPSATPTPGPNANDVPLPEPAAPSPGANDSLFLQPPPAANAPGTSGIPDLLPGTAGGNQPVIRKSSTSSSLAELQAKIHFRQANTRAANDPALQQQLAYAQSQPTEPEYRQEMRLYYQRLQKRVVAIDPSVKDLAGAALQMQNQMLSQKRLRTTSAEEVRTDRAARSNPAQ